MNRYLKIGLAAAAVVVIAVVGYQFLGDSNTGSTGASESAEPSATATPSEPASSVAPSAEAFLPEGQFAWWLPAVPPQPPEDGPPVTVTIPASGWTCPGANFAACGLTKGDDSDTFPESRFIAVSTTAGILVYEDACQWENPVQHPPATTADDIAAALAAQPSRDATDPVDVTVGGYPGKEVTLHVPDDLGYANAGFTDCFRGVYASYTLEGYDTTGTHPWHWHQRPGQIDTFWIVEVDDAIVIIDAMYRADTPADRIEEMRAIAESATFQ